ncbi:hypothetical protein BDN70DRAFT_308146 [Pholiota conissans]|uniref:Uncharacterized protein n=1 Tax=Pholiota conissans TaxID=109636 RepID=A0A9P5YRN2_9AGAR|nr:hypothetical protein BDN70DRAFT_308146 [Pholiota conissans]
MSTSIQGTSTGDTSSPRLQHCMISSEKKLTINNGKFMQVLGDVHLYATSPFDASDWTSATQTTREDESNLNMLLSGEGIQSSGNSYVVHGNLHQHIHYHHSSSLARASTKFRAWMRHAKRHLCL